MREFAHRSKGTSPKYPFTNGIFYEPFKSRHTPSGESGNLVYRRLLTAPTVAVGNEARFVAVCVWRLLVAYRRAVLACGAGEPSPARFPNARIVHKPSDSICNALGPNTLLYRKTSEIPQN